jgi:hypothetical protein
MSNVMFHRKVNGFSDGETLAGRASSNVIRGRRTRTGCVLSLNCTIKPPFWSTFIIAFMLDPDL